MSKCTQSEKHTLIQPTLWMCISSPVHSFRLRTLRGVHENEAFLAGYDPVYNVLPPEKRRDEAYKFMNLQRNILWIVRFFALAFAGVAYYLLFKHGQ
ncbi:MAG: hypothetical protein EXS51_01160 [Candidatus Taylorbacteria bacterium]|nr:hypothetical protein [Candidatus Taylorbacteria bacterium]